MVRILWKFPAHPNPPNGGLWAFAPKPKSFDGTRSRGPPLWGYAGQLRPHKLIITVRRDSMSEMNHEMSE